MQENKQDNTLQQEKQDNGYENQLVKWRQDTPSQILETMSKVNLASSTYTGWSTSKQLQLCKYMTEWGIEALWIGDNMHSAMLLDLKDILFSKLIRIDISNNCIESLEPICRIQFPALKEIYLQDNFLTSVHSLHKCNMPDLYFIGIGNNPIKQIQQLSLANFPSLKWLGLDHTENRNFITDIRWVAKINTQILNMLQMENRFRWGWDKFDEVLKRKYLQVQINRN